MYSVKTQEERDFLKSHFQVELDDTLLDAAFLGFHGRILVDEIKNPRVMFVDVGHTFYYYGDSWAKEAKDFASLVDDYAEIHASDAWIKLIKEEYLDQVHELTRYEMDDTKLDLRHLKKIISTIPNDFTVRRIDKELYDDVLKTPWTKSMVEHFLDKEDFLENGHGYLLIDSKGMIVSGASSFTRYSEGYEVEIGTHKDHRRKGFARMIGAYFIKAVMESGKHAHWDAANKESKELAKKLGYQLKRAYNIIEVY